MPDPAYPQIDRPLPTMVFFWSRTCGHSRRMDSLIDHFMRLHRGKLRLAKIEVSDRGDLARRLQITEAPTVLLLQDLVEVARVEGRATLPGIKAAVEPHLDLEDLPVASLAGVLAAAAS